MSLYTIFLGDYPLFEGKDGRYWLGGSPKNLTAGTLVFFRKSEAERALKQIIGKIKDDNEYENSILRKEIKTLKVVRFEMLPY